jgi:hypothetical protein
VEKDHCQNVGAFFEAWAVVHILAYDLSVKILGRRQHNF